MSEERGNHRVEFRVAWDNLSRGVRPLAIFGLFMLALTIGLDAGITAGLRRTHTSNFGVWNRIVRGDVDADVIISGSSRALVHYDPRLIEGRTGLKAFNIGLNGSQTDLQIARFKTYLQHNKKPRLLIHNLDVFSLQTTHGAVYDPVQYAPYLGEDTLYPVLRRIDPDFSKAKFVPLYAYAVQDLTFKWMLGLLGLFGWNPAEDHFLGFEPRHSAWTEDFQRFKIANPDGVSFEIEPAGVREIETLLAFCKEQGIKALLIYSPEYVEMQNITRDRAKVFARFDELSHLYGVRFWDYSDSLISRQTANFSNSQHLNADGAALFSQDVAERIASDPSLLDIAHATENVREAQKQPDGN
jgi:hypothetical protein